MSDSRAVDVAIVGSGFCGLLAARELVDAGREVAVIERGGMRSHAEQLADGEFEADLATAAHNHERDDDAPYDWDYLYAVGGSSLHWGGVAPRFLPSDFELRSRFGVARDWPIGYAELEPFYQEAERGLGVAGGPNELIPRRRPYPLPPHPFAPVDELIRGYFEPYHALPQARPTRSIGGRPACCASGRCTLCPVDAKYTMLHTIADDRLLSRPNLSLRDATAVARLRRQGRRVVALECIRADGENIELRANTVILAASGIENAAILLRSDLGGPDVGRWLHDHQHRVFHVLLDRSAGVGRGTTIATGISYAFAEGEFRSRRGAIVVYPENRGRFMLDPLSEAVLDGRAGKAGRRRLRTTFERTLLLDTLGEDLPRRDRFVELSSRKDGLGLPYNRIRYPHTSDYLGATYEHLATEIERRLRPLGGRIVRTYSYGGAHLLGTARMGEGEGVVDRHQRHHDFDNLYVAGGSSFPTYSAVHPTLTIAALAIRLGRHVARAER